MYDPDPARPTLRLGAPAPAEPAPAITVKTEDDLVLEVALMLYRAVESVRRAHRQSQPIPASAPVISADNDFWTHRHRCETHAAGPTAMVFRSSGHVERLEAAACGEIGDPAEQLRREKLALALAGFEPLDAPL